MLVKLCGYKKSHFSAEYLHKCKSDLGIWMFIRKAKKYVCVRQLVTLQVLTKNEKDGDVTC